MNIALLLPLLCPQAETSTPTFEDQARALAVQYVEAERVVGMSIGVIAPDGTVTHFGVGRHSRADERVPDERSLYEIGSMTKVLTGVLLADAVGREEVRLEDTVASLLPKEVELAAHRKGPIQLVHLSTHSSGLPRMPKNFDLERADQGWADYGADELYTFLSEFKPRRKPGDRYAYSNLAVGLLGHLLQRKTGVPYEQLLVDRLCTPLGLHDTRLRLSEKQDERFVQGHDANLDEASAWNMNVLAPCGGVRSSVADMLLFLEANLATDSALQDSLALAREVHSTHRGAGSLVGLGWHVAGDGATRVHSGQTGGYHSYLAVNTKLRIGVVVLGNTASPQIDGLGDALFNLSLGVAVPGPEFKTPLKLTDEELERYAGRFRVPDVFALELTAQNGKLYAQVDGPGQGRMRVVPTSKTEFEYVELPATIEFELTAKDEVTGLIFRQNGLEFRCEPE